MLCRHKSFTTAQSQMKYDDKKAGNCKSPVRLQFSFCKRTGSLPFLRMFKDRELLRLAGFGRKCVRPRQWLSGIRNTYGPKTGTT